MANQIRISVKLVGVEPGLDARSFAEVEDGACWAVAIFSWPLFFSDFWSGGKRGEERGRCGAWRCVARGLGMRGQVAHDGEDDCYRQPAPSGPETVEVFPQPLEQSRLRSMPTNLH